MTVSYTRYSLPNTMPRISLLFAALAGLFQPTQQLSAQVPPGCTFVNYCNAPAPPSCDGTHCVTCNCYGESRIMCPKEDGDGCTDHNNCTSGDYCQGGTCVPGDVCPTVDLGEPCANWGCVEEGDGPRCNYIYEPAGTACQFTNFCQSGHCNGTSVSCQPPIVQTCPDPCFPCDEDLDACVPVDCSDGNACNGQEWCDSSDEEDPCKPDPNGPLVCGDSNVCNGSEWCDEETGCVHGESLDCDDENPCTDDWCNAESGCDHANNTRSCDDEDACTEGEQCGAGACGGGVPKVCDDDNICNGLEICETGTGCVKGSPLDCDDGVTCNIDHCDSEEGCQNGCFASSAPEGLLPKKNDRTFVYKGDHHLVAGVNTFDNHLKVTRYAGPIDLDGHLNNAAEFYDHGIADPSGILRIYAYGVTSGTQHAVFFNGIYRGNLKPSPSCKWSTSTFSIPLDQIKFPAKGFQGSAPLPRANTIAITVNGLHECLRFRGASLSVKLTSPIILIHGTNSDAEFFTRQRFAGFDGANRLGLDSQYLLVDQSINMETAPRNANAALLNITPFGPTPDIPDIATSYGVDSIHLIAHSKGGLDTRDYLQFYQKAHDEQFKVLSFTTLSTPHNGSILADMVIARRNAAIKASKFDFPGFPAMSGLLADLNALSESVWGIDLGVESLTTTVCDKFNIENLLPGALPNDIIYNTVSADADCNSNAEIDASQPEEWNDLYTESVHGLPWGVNWAYQVLRSTSGVKVEYRKYTDIQGMFWVTRTLGVVVAIPGGPFPNDALVTLDSAQGVGSFGNRRRLADQNGIVRTCKNHASVADEGIAALVGPWIVNVERENGDLRP